MLFIYKKQNVFKDDSDVPKTKRDERFFTRGDEKRRFVENKLREVLRGMGIRRY